MSSYPTAKVHRRSRRQLGRGQSVMRPAATVVPTVSTTTVTLTFSEPVIANGVIPVVYDGGSITILSQAQTSPTVITQTLSATGASATWVFPNSPSQVLTAQGGPVAGASGTF